MEDKIKDFDRSIEQKMNESAVPPSFGMWNRIAAELDAEPVAAPVNSAFPKSAMVGLVIGALILGGILTANWLGRNPVKEQLPAQMSIGGNTTVQPVRTVVPAVVSTVAIPVSTEKTTSGINEEPTAAITTNTDRNHNSIKINNNLSKPVEENTAIAKEETSAPIVATTNVTLQTANSNSEVAAPVQSSTTGIGTVSEVYYFPPVDRVVNEKSSDNKDKSLSSSSSSRINSNGDEDDKKVTPAKEQKIRFKPPHKHRWGYGKIIRNK